MVFTRNFVRHPRMQRVTSLVDTPSRWFVFYAPSDPRLAESRCQAVDDFPAHGFPFGGICFLVFCKVN